MRGMRVCPPTRTTSLILLASTPASFMHCLHGPTERWIRSSTIDSSLARVIFLTKCLGPLASAVMKGRLILVFMVGGGLILARFAASPRSRHAHLFPLPPRASTSYLFYLFI